MEKLINVTRSSLPEFDEFCREIAPIWESRWLTNMGEKHKALQKALEERMGIPHVTLYTNGHLALENMLEALELKGEIITTPYTFASTTHAIVRCGCTPVFCDVNEDDYTIDVSKLEALITDRTVAIMPVHVYGSLCDVEAIEAIAKRHGLYVLYDAAHAFGVKKDGIDAACFGDVSMFSFHATKVFNTIEGGALCYANDTLVTRLNDIKNFGIHSAERVQYVGGNAKMNEFCAAMGLCNLRQLDEEIAKRKLAADRYDEHLSGVKGLKLRPVQEGVSSNYAYYPVIFDGYKYTRDEVFERLAKENVIARKYFYPITNAFDCYKGREGFDPDATPVAKRLAENVLTLPMYADLTVEEVDRICRIILE